VAFVSDFGDNCAREGANMPDIFVSYASDDRVKVTALVQLFQSAGWSVWWDQHMEGGVVWSEEIEQRVAAARCVVVFWSRASITKEWVIREATAALNAKSLVPVLLEPVMLPKDFEHVHAARLTTWLGDQQSFELKPLLDRIAALLGTEPPKVDDRLLEYTAEKMTRTSVAEAVFEFCTARLDFFRRQARGQYMPKEFLDRMRDTYDALLTALSPITNDELHDLITRYERAFTP
jgi:hypothetical protein